MPLATGTGGKIGWFPISLVKDRIPGIKCYIYGEGDLRKTLEEKVRKLNLEQNVFLPGNVSNIEDHLASCNVFVMTSYFEGASNALMEAMALRKACISTNYPGADEIINDEENGFLVSCDDVKALADRIILIIENDGIRHKIMNNAYNSAQRYSYTEILKKWEYLIESVVN